MGQIDCPCQAECVCSEGCCPDECCGYDDCCCEPVDFHRDMWDSFCRLLGQATLGYAAGNSAWQAVKWLMF